MRTALANLRRILSGVSALATLLALIAGVPVFLAKASGGPLPTKLPSWSEFSAALTHTEIPLSLLTKTLACVGWATWMALTVSIGVEFAAWIAGRHAPRVRFAGPLQPFARSLITSAAVLFSFNPLAASMGSAALPSDLAFTAVTEPVAAVTAAAGSVPVSARIPSPVPTAAASRAPAEQISDAPPVVKQHTVRRHDTLWDLAERHLGDPYRWEEIWNLNCGGGQADGRVFTDPHWIYPGWVLTMPADATGVEEVALAIAEPILPAPAATGEPTSPDPINEPDPTPGSTPTIAPAEVSPPSTAEPAAETAPPESPTTTPARVPPSSDVAPATSAIPRFPVRVPWIAGGLCAAGLVVLLDRLRRAQRRRRKAGEPLHAPPADLAPLETGLRRSAAANEDRCVLLDAALRAFAAGAFGDPTMRTPRLLAVRSYPDSVELLFDQPIDGTVLGFSAQSGNRLWVTEPGLTVELLHHLADDVGPPYPALVTLGEVDGGDLLVDIETAGALCLHGKETHPADLFRRLAIEVSTSRWGGYFDIITVGDVPDFAGFERSQRLPSIDEALDALNATANEIDESLTAIGATSTVAPRVSYALGDGWTPSIFITDQTLDGRQLNRLLSIVGQGGRGVGALLLGSAPTGNWNLRCDAAEAHLDPVDLDIAPLAMPELHAEGIDALLADAAVGHLTPDALDPEHDGTIGGFDANPGTGVPPDESHHEKEAEPEAEAGSPTRSAVAETAVADIGDAPPVVAPPMVRVMGVVTIDNINHEGRRKVIELIVYLALHPDGVSADRLTEALWPDATPGPATLTRNVCYARRALGLDHNGKHHLPRRTTESRYQLGPHVRCDLLEFLDLAKKARETDDTEQQVALLGAALDLVRDKPFDSIIDYEWAWTENWIAVAETEIAECAATLAKLHLAANQPSEARRTALAGLRVAPDDQRLRTLTGQEPSDEAIL